MSNTQRAEKAQIELNKILGKTQTPQEFSQSVAERLSRMNTPKPQKEKRKVSANRSLFQSL